MENVRRYPARSVKARIEDGFVYNSEIEFLTRRENAAQPQDIDSDANAQISSIDTGNNKYGKLTWTDLDLSECNNDYKEEDNIVSKEEYELVKQEAARLLAPNINDEEEEASVQFNVNKLGAVRTSSTRFDFLSDLDNCFLSASSVEHLDTSNMASGDERVLELNKKGTCEECVRGLCESHGRRSESGNALNKSTQDMLQELISAVSKIDTLSNQMANMQCVINRQHSMLVSQEKRLREVEAGKNNGGRDSSPEGAKGGVTNGCDSLGKLYEGKTRSLKVIQEQIDLNNKIISDSDLESCTSGIGDVNRNNIKKRMSKKQRDLSNSKSSRRLKEAGAVFPEDEFVSTNSSGEESCVKRCSHSKSVKSGAKVKKRPVLRTELWPHTIANEEDGDDVDSESISLTKFFKCFSTILSECVGRQAEGRIVLQKAIFLVLEFLPWTEARNFHNLTMLKLEQGRIDWETDFLSLADAFIEKKVRAGLRSKQPASGYVQSARSNTSGRGNYRGFRGNNNTSNSNYGNPLLKAICWQWNSGSCTYGDESCKRWHCCKICAESGKLGEKHPASSHNNSSSNTRDNQRGRDNRRV